MSKRKAEDEVKPLDGGADPHQDKKHKTGEGKETKEEPKYADQITIRYEPANLSEDRWERYETSFYMLKAHCTNGFFSENKTIPDPPELVITSEIPRGRLYDFLTYTVKSPFAMSWFMSSDAMTETGISLALQSFSRAFGFATWFDHTPFIEFYNKYVITVMAKLTDTSIKIPDEVIEGLVWYASKLNRKSELYAKLIHGFQCIKKRLGFLIRHKESQDQYATVFADMQRASWFHAPPEVRKMVGHVKCNKHGVFGSQSDRIERVEYVRHLLSSSADKTIDWNEIMAVKFCPMCKDDKNSIIVVS
jgi:hypothetical protein